MSLATNAPRDIEIYIAEQLSALKFPAFLISELKTGAARRYSAAYVRDTSKPAWCDVNGVWRYADGTTV